MAEPQVLQVQHFCLHDGPGVRSLVFLKGCPLRCAWCQNPESNRAGPERAFKAAKCIACGTCVEVCPEAAIDAPGRHDPAKCRLCFRCVERCPAEALVRFGEPRTAESVVEEIRPELPLLRSSGGGVTLTGGEPALHPELATALALAFRALEVHVAMETCGHFRHEDASALLSSLDLVLFDLKLFDDGEHRRLCGAGNGKVKENLRALAAARGAGAGPKVWPRLPLVPGMTDAEENLRGWAGLLRELGLTRLTLVPYHRLGEGKREWLGLPPGPAVQPLTREALEAARGLLAAEGISACAPGDEDWEEP
ncbi:MAG: glycyl-radical enzyme activating protein [Myxococcaceae bacterium]